MQGQKIFQTTKQLKQQIDFLQCKAKNLLKRRLDFPFEKTIETRKRLPTIQGQKIVETTVRFFIQQMN